MGDRLNLNRQWQTSNRKIRNNNLSLPLDNNEDKNDFMDIHGSVNLLIRTIGLYATISVSPKFSQSLMNADNKMFCNSIESTKNDLSLMSSTSISSRTSALHREKDRNETVIGAKRKKNQKQKKKEKEKEEEEDGDRENTSNEEKEPEVRISRSDMKYDKNVLRNKHKLCGNKNNDHHGRSGDVFGNALDLTLSDDNNDGDGDDDDDIETDRQNYTHNDNGINNLRSAGV